MDCNSWPTAMVVSARTSRFDGFCVIRTVPHVRQPSNPVEPDEKRFTNSESRHLSCSSGSGQDSCSGPCLATIGWPLDYSADRSAGTNLVWIRTSVASMRYQRVGGSVWDAYVGRTEDKRN